MSDELNHSFNYQEILTQSKRTKAPDNAKEYDGVEKAFKLSDQLTTRQNLQNMLKDMISTNEENFFLT